MDIETIPLSSLEADPRGTLHKCADTGQPVIVELPDHRLIALAPVESANDSLVDELLESNAAFQALVAKSKAGPHQPFVPVHRT